MSDPVDLSSHRKKKQHAERVHSLLRWVPSRTALYWMALAVAVVGGYFAFGQNRFFNQADMGGPHIGGIKECGLVRRTCLVDGDTGWQGGVKWRMLNVDAPEIDDKAQCDAERQKARGSLDRLAALMADGYSIKSSGKNDKFGRVLVDVVLSDGRNAGTVLLEERLTQRWPNDGNVWCSR